MVGAGAECSPSDPQLSAMSVCVLVLVQCCDRYEPAGLYLGQLYYVFVTLFYAAEHHHIVSYHIYLYR